MLDNSMPDSYHFSSYLFSLVNEKVYFIFLSVLWSCKGQYAGSCRQGIQKLS